MGNALSLEIKDLFNLIDFQMSWTKKLKKNVQKSILSRNLKNKFIFKELRKQSYKKILNI